MAVGSAQDARSRLIPFIVLFTALHASFGTVSPFLPVLLERPELHPNEIGLILALSTAIRLLSGPAAGRIADVFNALRAVFASTRWRPPRPRSDFATATTALRCAVGLQLPGPRMLFKRATHVCYNATNPTECAFYAWLDGGVNDYD
jgi:MFS family permease